MKLRLHAKAETQFEVYETELHEMSFGQAEDLIDAIDLDNLVFNTSDELANAIRLSLPKSFGKVCPLMLSMFGIPDEELKTVRVDELVRVLAEATSYVLNELAQCASNSNGPKKGSDDVPLFSMLFDLQLSLCDRFSGLTPFSLRHENLREVLSIMKRLNTRQTRSNETRERANNEIIRRPAQDDSWF